MENNLGIEGFDGNDKAFFRDEVIDEFIRSSQVPTRSKKDRVLLSLGPLLYAIYIALFIFSIFLILSTVWHIQYLEQKKHLAEELKKKRDFEMSIKKTKSPRN